MKAIIWVLLLAFLTWKFGPQVQSWVENMRAPTAIAHSVTEPGGLQRDPRSAQGPTPGPASVPFKCDGRKYCSQMTSCAEAKQFLQHCPGTKMDGDGDGVPCESQWCQ